MNWSKEWGKVETDANLYGTGWSKDGKHIPAENVHIRNLPEYENKGFPELKIATPVGTFGWNETREILYNDGNITRKVMVEVIGDLGLEFDDGNGWCIYHLPTLSRFDKAVPGYFPLNDRGSPQYVESFEYDKQPLLNWMAKVQTNYPTSWQMLRLLTPDNYKDNGQVAKDILMEWCLSVKVE